MRRAAKVDHNQGAIVGARRADMTFEKIKSHIADMAKLDPDYAAWARANYRRILAVFFAWDK